MRLLVLARADTSSAISTEYRRGILGLGLLDPNEEEREGGSQIRVSIAGERLELSGSL